jgi:hypothetical protein
MQLRDSHKKLRKGRIVATLAGTASLLALLPATGASADGGREDRDVSTYAVYGDSPYGADHAQYNATPAFIGGINADPQVGGVINIGDLHSGSEACTQVYDQGVAEMWKSFADPVYYTPGDNEWADCQKTKQHPDQADAYQKGDPIANLALVRQLFFPQMGVTLGQNKKLVLSQAFAYDRRFPTDKQYVENTIWTHSGVVFVNINVPGGSNNDHDIWNSFTTGVTGETPAQHDEYTNRTAADLRWLDTAFFLAKVTRAKGVLIGAQADMWDTEKNDPAILTNYKPIVDKIANRTHDFGGSVLLINGDTHVYRSDNPLVNDAACTTEAAFLARCAPDHDAYNLQPGGYDLGAAKFHRIVVHGSTSPMEWLKLTVDPSQNAPESANAVGPFSWTRVPTQLPSA